MNRAITYQITEEYAPVKIQHFLRRRGFSRQCLIQLKKTEGSVTVNGIPKHFNERLYPGDTLRLFITETTVSDVLPVHLPIDIIYEDEDILVVNKPAGMPTHPSFKNTDNTLANALAWYYREKDLPFVFRCSNRLDRDTSGLTIVSRHFVSAAIISEMGTRREISREYLAIVQGQVSPAAGTVDAPLGRKDSSIIERCVDYAHGEKAVTHYRVVKYLPESHLTLVSLKLETGRTHQIRVHMQHLGHPLIGDYLYGECICPGIPEDEAVPAAPHGSRIRGTRAGISQSISRQALHAYRLSFTHPITGDALCFTAPLPEDMMRILSCDDGCDNGDVSPESSFTGASLPSFREDPHPQDTPPGSARSRPVPS